MRTQRLAVAGLASFAVLALHFGCLSVVDDRSEAVVGAGGGFIELDGVTLDVPPGAVSEDVPFSVAKVAPVAVPFGNRAGNTFRLGPEGTRFQKPVKVGLPLETRATRLAVATAPGEAGPWERLGARVEGGKVTFETSHFSLFVVVEDAGTDASTAEPADAAAEGGPDAFIPLPRDAGGPGNPDGSVYGKPDGGACVRTGYCANAGGVPNYGGTNCKAAFDCVTAYRELECMGGVCTCWDGTIASKRFATPSDACTINGFTRLWMCECGFPPISNVDGGY